LYQLISEGGNLLNKKASQTYRLQGLYFTSADRTGLTPFAESLTGYTFQKISNLWSRFSLY